MLFISKWFASAAWEQDCQHLDDVLAIEEGRWHLELLHKGQHSSYEVSRIPVLISTLVMVLIKLGAEMLAEASQDWLVE